MQSENHPSSPVEQDKKRKRKTTSKYESKEAQIAMSRIYTKEWIKKNQDRTWHCEICNKTYNYFAKSGHLKAKGHLKTVEKAEQDKDKIKEQIREDNDKMSLLFKNFVSAVEAVNMSTANKS